MLEKVSAVLAGLVMTALLFPFFGTTQCTETTTGGDCVEWSESVLIRYSGENGAVGMVIALVAGVATALVVYFLAHRLMGQRRTSSET